MDEHEIAEMLREAVCEHGEYTVHTESYEEAGVMTSNAGFVLMIGGQEFQVTVVRSR